MQLLKEAETRLSVACSCCLFDTAWNAFWDNVATMAVEAEDWRYSATPQYDWPYLKEPDTACWMQWIRCIIRCHHTLGFPIWIVLASVVVQCKLMLVISLIVVPVEFCLCSVQSTQRWKQYFLSCWVLEGIAFCCASCISLSVFVVHICCRRVLQARVALILLGYVHNFQQLLQEGCQTLHRC